MAALSKHLFSNMGGSFSQVTCFACHMLLLFKQPRTTDWTPKIMDLIDNGPLICKLVCPYFSISLSLVIVNIAQGSYDNNALQWPPKYLVPAVAVSISQTFDSCGKSWIQRPGLARAWDSGSGSQGPLLDHYITIIAETWAIVWSEFDRRYWHLLPERCKTWPGNGQVFILTKKYTNGGLKLNLKQNGTVLKGDYNVLHAFHLQNNHKSIFIRTFIKCRATDNSFCPELIGQITEMTSEWTLAHQHHMLCNGTYFSCVCIGEVGLSVCFHPPIVQGFSIRWTNVTQHCFVFLFLPPPPEFGFILCFFGCGRTAGE